MKVRFYFQEIVSAEISRWDEHSARYLFCQLLCLLFLFQQKRILLSRRTEQIQNKTIVNIWNTDRCDSFWNFYLIPHSFYMCQICIHFHLFHYCFRIYVMIIRKFVNFKTQYLSNKFPLGKMFQNEWIIFLSDKSLKRRTLICLCLSIQLRLVLF